MEIRNRIIRKVNHILCEQILHYQVEIASDELYLEKYEIDSMGFLNFLCIVEEEFAFEIDDDNWKYDHFATLSILADYIIDMKGVANVIL